MSASSDYVQPVVVQLPAGLMVKGELHREAEIVPMCGGTHVAIMDDTVKRDPSKIIDTILASCVKRVGPFTPVDTRVADALVLGDRDYLLVEIRKISLGSEVRTVFPCSNRNCRTQIDAVVDLNELPQQPMPSFDYIDMDNGNRIRVFRVKDEATKVDAVFRFPLGGDLRKLSALYQNMMSFNYALYWECLISFGGQPRESLPPNLFQVLPAMPLVAIRNGWADSQPGPVLVDSIICPKCGFDNSFSFLSADFFFPGRRVTKKKTGG